MKKLTTLTAVAFAALSLASSPVVAADQTVSTSNAGATDLILGFESATGTGSAVNLEIDLGPAASLASNTSLDSTIGADLVATYGSTWYSNTSLEWGIAAATSTNPLKPAFDVTSSTGAQRTNTYTALGTDFTNIGTLVNGFTGDSNASTVSGSNAVTIGSSASGDSATGGNHTDSFSALITSGGSYFKKPNAEVGTGTAPLGSLELYSYTGVPSGTAQPYAFGKDLGTFTLTAGTTPNLSFTAASVPEPSAYALGICAMLLFWVLKRRSSIA